MGRCPVAVFILVGGLEFEAAAATLAYENLALGIFFVAPGV